MISRWSPSPAPSRPRWGGGYYLDDGPGENPPADLESIPEPVPQPEPLRRATKDAADATEPGDLGDVTRARTGDAPAELAVGVLPDRVGRHNSPTRAESIRGSSRSRPI